MARSYKNTPISGITTCVSDKKDKQKASRNTRRRERVSLKVVDFSSNGDGGEEHLGVHRFEGNPSYFSKDGKQFHHGRSVKFARGPRFHRTFWKDLRK